LSVIRNGLFPSGLSPDIMDHVSSYHLQSDASFWDPTLVDFAMVEVVSHWPVTVEAQVQFWTRPYGIYGRHSCTETDFFWCTLVSPVSIISPVLSDHGT